MGRAARASTTGAIGDSTSISTSASALGAKCRRRGLRDGAPRPVRHRQFDCCPDLGRSPPLRHRAYAAPRGRHQQGDLGGAVPLLFHPDHPASTVPRVLRHTVERWKAMGREKVEAVEAWWKANFAAVEAWWKVGGSGGSGGKTRRWKRGGKGVFQPSQKPYPNATLWAGRCSSAAGDQAGSFFRD